jgi:hypothetical protein
MTDAQRSQLLKGLISRCTSKQVDYICTLLNLKSIQESNRSTLQHLVPTDIASKFPQQTRQTKNKLQKPTKQTSPMNPR